MEAPSSRSRARAAVRRQRTRAIVDAAVACAEKGGLGAVRLRDVAAVAGVSMGTLYRCFDSKEDILLYALSEDFSSLERYVAANPIAGDTALERVEAFFRLATRGLIERPNYARATIAATASGQRTAVRQVAVLNGRMANLIRAAIAPGATSSPNEQAGAADGALPGVSHGDQEVHAIARVLHRVWFSTLVGWAAGVHTAEELIAEMRTTAALLLRSTR